VHNLLLPYEVNGWFSLLCNKVTHLWWSRNIVRIMKSMRLLERDEICIHSFCWEIVLKSVTSKIEKAGVNITIDSHNKTI